VPETGQGLEPFHAVYRVATCLPAVEQAISAGEWKLSGWFERVRVHVLGPAVWGAYDPERAVFMNLNTPDDFREAEERGARGAR